MSWMSVDALMNFGWPEVASMVRTWLIGLRQSVKCRRVVCKNAIRAMNCARMPPPITGAFRMVWAVSNRNTGDRE